MIYKRVDLLLAMGLFLSCATMAGGDGHGERAAILLGPVLSFPGTTGLHVWWHTSQKRGYHAVEFGLTRGLERRVEFREITRYPFIELSGLRPGSLYYYRVRTEEEVSEVGSFRTLRPQGDFRIGLWADNQKGRKVFQEGTIQALKRQNPDFLMAVGDLVQRGERYGQWGRHLYRPARELLRGRAWFPVRGNHDGESKLAQAMLPFPGGRSWYSFVHGPLFAIVLDTNLDYKPGTPQYQWLLDQTHSSQWASAGFRMVAFHHTPFTTLWDDHTYNGEDDARKYLVPLMEASGTDVVFSGHAHCYEHGVRRTPHGKTHYFVIGGGGDALDTIPVGDWPHVVEKASVHHIAVVDVSQERMRIKIIPTVDRRAINCVTITAGPLAAEKG